jgi:hypothetical protein
MSLAPLRLHSRARDFWLEFSDWGKDIATDAGDPKRCREERAAIKTQSSLDKELLKRTLK